MSIFSADIQHPIDPLYDQCKDVVERIIPMNMMHYNADCKTMERDIISMLKEKGLWVGDSNHKVCEDDIFKINKVCVSMGGYARRIPFYLVYLYYVKEIHNEPEFEGITVQYTAFLTQFNVGINGIINESI